MTTAAPALTDKILNATVLVTGLGMLVDFYDFIIFNMVRVPSLTDLGLTGDALTATGLNIVSWQALGLLIGAYMWGKLGDRLGRKSCVLGSILTYSLATLACAFVQSPDMYAVARFFAGVGVAGELGIGLTMVSERMSAERRGYGALVFLCMGFMGAVLAAGVAMSLPWRTAYFIGGIAGLLVLGLRALLFETPLYQNIDGTDAVRGGLRFILARRRLAVKYIANIVMLVPVVFVVQFIWTLSPEFARAFGIAETVNASMVMAIGYSCVMVGDALAIVASQWMQRRRPVIGAFLVLSTIIIGAYLILAPSSLSLFYAFNGLIGLSFGVWMLGATVASEQFGTNLRATVATTTPNFARGLTLVMGPTLLALKGSLGLIGAVAAVGGTTIVLAFLALFLIDETYGKDLDYVER